MDKLYYIFPLHLREFLKAGFQMKEKPEEIRIRIGQPVILDTGSQEWYRDKKSGMLTKDVHRAYRASEGDLKELVSYMSEYSMYAFEEEVRKGFLTIQGGHRIGIAGKAVCQQERIQTMRQISSLNIRIAKEHKGCADIALPYIRKGQSIYNTLIISPPGVGKTSLLRDCIRRLSDGNEVYKGLKVGVVDERSEIAACYQGKPQNDLGCRTDVMDACPKKEGMLLLLRSMSPQVIAVDELGGSADYEAVEYAIHCGCRLLGTIHGTDLEEMKQKPYLEKWLEEKFFERYLVLEKDKQNQRKISIFNERLEQIC